LSDNIESKSLKKGYNIKCSGKKIKLRYELEKEAEQLIIADKSNKRYWDDCKELLDNGKKVYNLF